LCKFFISAGGDRFRMMEWPRRWVRARWDAESVGAGAGGWSKAELDDGAFATRMSPMHRGRKCSGAMDGDYAAILMKGFHFLHSRPSLINSTLRLSSRRRGRQAKTRQENKTLSPLCIRMSGTAAILDASLSPRNSTRGGSSQEDQKGMWESPCKTEGSVRSCPRNCERQAKTIVSLGQPGKTVKGTDPRARRPAAAGALIGADRAGGSFAQKMETRGFALHPSRFAPCLAH